VVGLNSIAFSPNGRLVVSGSYGLFGMLRLVKWSRDLSEGHLDAVNSVAFSSGPNDKLITSRSYDTSIHIWDIKTGKTILAPYANS
jgi:WD40 repeat protein